MIIGYISFTLNGGEVRTARYVQEEAKCFQKLHFTEDQYAAILSGESKPSVTTMRNHGLLVNNGFNGLKWAKYSPYQRMMIFYEDHMHDIGAVSFTVNFV
jgi:hypothetical protein